MLPQSPLISATELQHVIQNPSTPFLLFDCRFHLTKPHLGYEQYAEGHIPGAVYVDLEKVLSGPKNPLQGRHPLPSPENWAHQRAQLGIETNAVVILYDDSENTYSARMWWMLRATGHLRVHIVDGGYRAWLKQVGTVETQENTPSPTAQRLPAVNYVGLVTMSDIQNQLSRPSFTILDARAAERFRGEVEPLDPVAGHIPGAINQAYKNNLHEDFLFKSKDELRQMFMPYPPHCVVHQCGSGVTACHNLLAMEIAGLSGSLLYAGSWSEWCQDPQNPVAKGP